MLYAARAALSEQERYAKTHTGVWHLFRETFVLTGEFDERLAADAQRARARREALDYEATALPRHTVEATVAQAERFVDAVDALLET